MQAIYHRFLPSFFKWYFHWHCWFSREITEQTSMEHTAQPSALGVREADGNINSIRTVSPGTLCNDVARSHGPVITTWSRSWHSSGNFLWLNLDSISVIRCSAWRQLRFAPHLLFHFPGSKTISLCMCLLQRSDSICIIHGESGCAFIIIWPIKLVSMACILNLKLAQHQKTK